MLFKNKKPLNSFIMEIIDNHRKLEGQFYKKFKQKTLKI
jgi:hypothetical protein